MAQYDVFVSYCQGYKNIALEICSKLEKLGLFCFSDPIGLYNFANDVQSAIISSKYFIFVYGGNSENSVFQRRELDLALESNKKIITLFTTCNDGVVYSILMKRTICCIDIDDVCNNVKKEIFPEEIPLCCAKNHRKHSKKWYILLGLVAIVVIGLLCYYFYYAISSPAPSSSISQSENNTNVPEVLDGDTVCMPSKGGDNDGTKSEITSMPPSLDWERWILSNKLISVLSGVLSVVIFLLIIKVCRKKKNIKLSSDVNVSVSIDGRSVAKINAGDVYATYLSKGEYIIDFLSNHEEHNRIVQKIADKDTHVIFSEFLNKKEIKFKCFIAGSLALSIERNALIATVSKMYNRWESERFRITSYTFEDFNRDVVPGGQQMLYDKFIENDADWCIFIISNGIGEKTLNEYKVAMNSLKRNGHPKILFLSSSKSINDETLSAIKKEMMATDQYWNTYYNLEHMQSIFRECVEWDIIMLSKRKR